LNFDVLRLVALREGGTIEETLATENKREVLIRAPAHVHSAPATPCSGIGLLASAKLNNQLWAFGALLKDLKSRITLRETWSRRQAGAMRPVRKAGWVWAASGAPAAKSCVG